MNELISIIMPAYNAEKTIAESVNSVIKQTYQKWELIIIFDGEACSVPQDERIVMLKNERNMGVAFSRNRGISVSRGEYIAFLDADDVWRADKLCRQLAFMRECGAAISYTASVFFGSDYVLAAKHQLTLRELLARNLMSCSSVMVEREYMLKYPFPCRKMCHEDFSVWMRIVREVGIAYGLDEPLLKYRLSSKSKSANRVRSAIMTFNAYVEVGYNFLAALLMTARYATWSIKKRSMIYSKLN